MPIPAGVLLAGSSLGGLFSGLGGASAAARSAKEQARQFNIGNAPGVARMQQSAGLRDQLLSAMSARFGAHPTTYTQAQGAYQPSQALGEQEDLYHRLMNQMGYRNLGQGQLPGHQAGMPDFFQNLIKQHTGR